jgi:hypothetical protein
VILTSEFACAVAVIVQPAIGAIASALWLFAATAFFASRPPVARTQGCGCMGSSAVNTQSESTVRDVVIRNGLLAAACLLTASAALLEMPSSRARLLTGIASATVAIGVSAIRTRREYAARVVL